MDALLDLLDPRTSAPTEPGFIIISQVKELLFNLLRIEFTAVRDRIDEDEVGEALWVLRRAARVQGLLQVCWDVLGALTPQEFAEFRDVLGSASGFQSFSYRRLEFVLGNKNPSMVDAHRNSPYYEDVLAQLREPSVYDATLALLARRGLPVPADVLAADPTKPYQASEEVERAWAQVYRDRRAHPDLHLLAEALVDAADLFARWRYTHLVTVQRLLGTKPGTGGTRGVAWLDRISSHRFFPELWAVRSTS
ncbi:tryptophan 2,3-dioxygenase [Saccharothrix syringae]|uniref:Tryptophan 2,3-dioxygenase n=2 Tax=Saccharothrix syringae TaxID=103733 RepID=A0A5Q0HFC9_SACSY|nr:tryptophan 2,3-dioxygenase [Saccharothrix syringae]